MNLGRESETLEFKKSTTEIDEAMDDICSILNKRGKGTLYFGVKPDGEVCGQQIGKDTLNDVARAVKEDIKPMIYPSIEEIALDGKPVIKVEFSGTEIPYSSRGIYYKRVADRAEEMTPYELRNVMLDTDYSSSWENRATKLTLEDVDEDALRRFYEASVRCGRLEPLEAYEPMELLRTLGLAEGDCLTNAGAYLFSNKDLVVLKMAVFVTDEKIEMSDMNRVYGNIYNLIEKGLSYIKEHMNWAVRYDGVSAAREEVPEIPIDAIREAIVNAFAHANYRSDIEHEISISPSAVEIFNPGEFPAEYRPEDFVNQILPSIPRNKKILDILYRCKDVESQGRGIRKIYHLCQKEGVMVSYRLSDLGFRLVFSRGNQVSRHPTDLLRLTKTDKMVLQTVKTIPHANLAALSKETNKGVRTIQRSLQKLIALGKVRRVGGNRNCYWQAVE